MSTFTPANTSEIELHFEDGHAPHLIDSLEGRIERFTLDNTMDIDHKVNLMTEGVEIRTQTEGKYSGWGLCLWTHLSEHDIDREDNNAFVLEEGPNTLRRIKFQCDKVIEWLEWKKICIPRMQYAKTLEIPHLQELTPHKAKCAIVGAGPTVLDFTQKIGKFNHETDMLMSVNGTHDWMIKQGLVPKIHVICEHDVDDIELSLGGPPHKDVYYYLSSVCDEKLFKQLEGYHRVLYHQYLPPQEYQTLIGQFFPQEFMIGGGYATFFKSLTIAIVLGYRNFDLFGMDSSFTDSSHMDGYKIANIEDKLEIWGSDSTGRKRKKFTTQGGLAYQAKEFLEFCKFNQSALRIRVHGDSLLRFVHESRYPEQYR